MYLAEHAQDELQVPKMGLKPQNPKMNKAKPTRILFWNSVPSKTNYELWPNEMRPIDILASYLGEP